MESKKIVSSLAYKFIERLSVKALGLIISVILARMIAPNDFGMLAILTVFINLSQTIIQGGLNTALVQSKHVEDKEYSTVFYISLAMAVFSITVLFVSAPKISNYYGDTGLIWPLRVYSFSLLFAAFNSVQVAKLQREMNFKVMMYSSLIATVVSGVIGITMAYIGLGIWALVAYNALSIVFSCLIMISTARWFPQLMFSYNSAKQLYSYGWKMLVSAILCSVYLDIRTLIIGKKFSTENLAYYNRGQQFPNIISTTLDSSIQSVMFSALSSCQDDSQKVKSLLKKSVTLSAFLVTPIMVGLALTSDAIVRILLTEKWVPCVMYMQITCLAEVTTPLTSANLVAIKAIGRSDVYIKLEAVRRLAMILVLLVSVLCFKSVKAIVVGYLISSWLDYFIIMIPIKRLFCYGFYEQIRDLWKIFLACACMGVVIYLIPLFGMNTYCELFIQIAVGVVSYVIVCSILKIESFDYLKKYVLKSIFHK